MTDHECVWELGDIGTTRHVRVGWVCGSPSCSKFLTVTQVGIRLNATERLSAKMAGEIAEHYRNLVEDNGSLWLEERQEALHAYAKARGDQ